MSKQNSLEGIVYCMKAKETPGLVKIGRTAKLSNRNQIISDGYKHVALEYYYAIKVSDCIKVEELLHDVFKYCRLGDTELFAVNPYLVERLMVELNGSQVYPDPKKVSKKEIMAEIKEKSDTDLLPDGTYKFAVKPRGDKKTYSATMVKTNGSLYLKEGSEIVNNNSEKITIKGWKTKRKSLPIVNGILQKDEQCDSVSCATVMVCGNHRDGWESWKNLNGEVINIYRQNRITGCDE